MSDSSDIWTDPWMGSETGSMLSPGTFPGDHMHQPSKPHPVVVMPFHPRGIRPITLKVMSHPVEKREVHVGLDFPTIDPQTVPPSMARIRGQFLLLATFGAAVTLSWLLGG